MIHARTYRTQEANRREAIERLVELIERACEQPPPRRATRPTAASRNADSMPRNTAAPSKRADGRATAVKSEHRAEIQSNMRVTFMTLRWAHNRFTRQAAHGLFAWVILAVLPASVRADELTLAGHWQSAIETPGAPLYIDVDFAPGKSGSWQGDISIPAQGAKDLPLAKIERKDADVTFELPGVPGAPTFKGKLDTQGKKLAGTYTQGDKPLPFHLNRGPDPVAAAKESLAGFDSFVNQAMTAWEVPGLAIAIVKDGEVI